MVYYSVKCHLYCWSLTFSNLVAPKRAVYYFLRAFVKLLVKLEGQQLFFSSYICHYWQIHIAGGWLPSCEC